LRTKKGEKETELAKWLINQKKALRGEGIGECYQSTQTLLDEELPNWGTNRKQNNFYK